MNDKLWDNVDNYLESALMEPDDLLRGALRASGEGGLPNIAVSPLQGEFLHLLVRLMGAKRILEVGTLGGYSAICMARALPPGGKLISLEVDPHHAEVARANIERAGLSEMVEVRVGAGLDTLPVLAEEVGEGSFDLSFIDADKPNNPGYFSWALRLTRPGGAIVVDNVVRDGMVADANSTDANVIGVRKLFEAMGAEPTIAATALQTVGVKGYDGFAIAVVAPRPGTP
jgi:predicted O-methyltransferase YrrM